MPQKTAKKGFLRGRISCVKNNDVLVAYVVEGMIL